jgi:hypothetical protein
VGNERLREGTSGGVWEAKKKEIGGGGEEFKKSKKMEGNLRRKGSKRRIGEG